MKASTKIEPQPSRKFPLWLPLIIIAGVALIAVALISSNRASTPASTPEVASAPALQVDKEKVDFRLHLPINTPDQSDKTVQILSNWQ